MRKILISIMSIILLVTSIGAVDVNALQYEEYTVSIERLDNGDYIETIIISEVINDGISVCANSFVQSGTKISEYKNAAGVVMWSVSVHGEFRVVPSSSSVCITSVGDAHSYSSNWRVANATSSKIADKATASTVAAQYDGNMYVGSVSRSVTLTCDKYGNLS